MLHRSRHGGHSRLRGATIDRVRMHEAVTTIAFGGRRRRVYGRIVALAGAKPGDRVLDVGCGGGYLARLLAVAVTPAGQVTGVDTSGAAIRYARLRSPGNCTFLVGAAQELGLPDSSFDVVTSSLAVHHIPEAARLAAFREMYRVLIPGGRLLVADFRPSGRGLALHPGSNAMRHNDVSLLDDLATSAGFRIEAHGELPMLGYLKAIRPGET